MINRDDFIEAEALVEVDGVYHPESEVKEALKAKAETNWLELLGAFTCWFGFLGLIAYLWSVLVG